MEEEEFDTSFLRMDYTYEDATQDMLKRYESDPFVYEMGGRVARLGLTEDGGAYIQTVDLRDTEPAYKLARDYGPAREYIDNYDSYLETGRLEIPRPFSPGYKRYTSVYQYVYDTFRRICVLTKSEPRSETRFGKWYQEKYSKEGSLLFREFMVTNVLSSGVGMAFNPFSAYGSVLVVEINYEDKRVYGTYRFDGKNYKFEWWFHHRCFIYNPDVWLASIPLKTPEFGAFSIVSDRRLSFHMPTLRKTNYIVPPYLIPVVKDESYDAGKEEASSVLGPIIGYKVPGVTYLYEKEEDFMIPVVRVGLCSLRAGSGVSYVAQVQDKEVYNKMSKVKYRDKILRGVDFYRPKCEVRPLPNFTRMLGVPDITRRDCGHTGRRVNLYRMAAMSPDGDLEECAGTSYAKYQSEMSGCIYYLQVGKFEQSRIYRTPTGLKLRVSDAAAGWYDEIEEGEMTECNNFSYFVPTDLAAHVEVMRVIASFDVLTKVKLQQITRDKTELRRVEQMTFDVLLEDAPEETQIDYKEMENDPLLLGEYSMEFTED